MFLCLGGLTLMLKEKALEAVFYVFAKKERNIIHDYD